MLTDTHAHYHHRRFDSDRQSVIEKIHSAGIGKVIEVPISFESNCEVLKLAEKYPWIYPALGIHPNQTILLEKDKADNIVSDIEELFLNNNAVALGEVGLDYKRITDEADRACQRQWFERLINLAVKVNKPLILHVREAAFDALDILTSFNRCFSGVVHCYSENREISKKYMDMGFALGVGGSITYKTSENVRDAIKYAPGDMILAETDAPFLTPEFCSGKNTSLSIPCILYRISKLRGVSYECILSQTAENAMRIFGI